MNLMKLLRRPNLGVKIFALAFLSITSMILLLGYGTQQYVYRQFTKEQTRYVSHLLERTDLLLSQFMKDLQANMLALSGDERLLSDRADETVKLLENYRLFWNYDIKNLYVITPDGRMTGTSAYLWEVKGYDHVKSLLEHDRGMPASPYWTEPYMSPVSDYTISYIVPLTGSKGGSGGRGVLVADLDIQGILAAYGDWTYTSREDLLILSAKGLPLTTNSPYVAYDVFSKTYNVAGLQGELIEQASVTPRKFRDNAGNPLYVTRLASNKWGWQVLAVLKESELYKSVRWLRTYALAIGALGVVLSLVVSYYLTRSIVRPLRLMTGQMDKLSAGDFQTTVENRYRDEFGVLVRTFNKMVGRIKQLMDDLVRSEKAKKHYELKVLQSQIQPHFLYNTLNSISYLSRRGQTDDVDRMVTSLVALLQFHLDQIEELVPLAQEIEGVRHYAYLMSVRFPDTFVLELDVEEEALAALVPKFSVQPLVENAVFHGILPTQRFGSIVVTSEEAGDAYLIRIADDGEGMSAERAAELLAGDSGSGKPGYYHMGVRSVHDRLALYFGPAYGLMVESEPGRGTAVTMRIPKRKEAAE
ncbi:sensor histidine kinase [Paenibacillus cymbidii]|uniref:sensor histidine kinase n=1 Tax=Paenibacillus cymbidii TaxID=1639034 RepID=UPI001080B150|nr:histidine kinase [Paenibacillus cymbidii]